MRPPVLLASVCDFGWGSVGKLRLILDELDGVEVALDPRSTISDAATELLRDARQFVACARENATAALVINDPVAANDLTDIGVPTIYVDSLPYLWTTPAEVPRPTAVYCVQRTPFRELRPDSPLANRPGITWIEPIVPRARGRRGGTGIVVNVGGLHSHLAGSSTGAYLRMVVLPLAELLAGGGRPVAAVCGNLPPWACRELAAILPDSTEIGGRTPYEFEALLRRTDLLITSPGSTTLLQAAALALPTMLLPPQNLSQILNAEIFAKAGSGVVHWPSSVLDRTEVDRLRPRGEDAVLEHIYGAINAAEQRPQVRVEVATAIRSAFETLPAEGALSVDVSALGTGGAAQVGRLVRQALFAPFPRRRVPA
jgi:hydroxymethylcytosylglucuronate/cytosylglucuronate synthase